MLRELRQLPAPAKLNLFLHVTGRRADGYHLLETVFRFVDLNDRVDLVLRDDGEIRRIGVPPEGIAASDDLTLRAARALQVATGCRLGVGIGLRKQIPVGAGLGGGSSDAATTLLGLNRLWGLGLDRRALIEIARPLGADVPVFVYGRNAYATGIGDRFRPVRLPPCWYVLLMPPIGVATAGVFSDPKLTRNTKPITISGFSRSVSPLPGRNDLEPVVVARQPAVRAALKALQRAMQAPRRSGPSGSSGSSGPAGLAVRMTGSGACVFAVVPDAESGRAVVARLAARMLSKGPAPSSGPQNVGTVHLVAGLPEHPLGSRQVG